MLKVVTRQLWCRGSNGCTVHFWMFPLFEGHFYYKLCDHGLLCYCICFYRVAIVFPPPPPLSILPLLMCSSSYAMRYTAMQLRLTLQTKFPEAPEDDVLKVVGNLLYYRYMNPAIVAPDGFGIVETGMDKQLTPDQRRNLGSIAKVLQHAAANKLVSWTQHA